LNDSEEHVTKEGLLNQLKQVEAHVYKRATMSLNEGIEGAENCRRYMKRFLDFKLGGKRQLGLRLANAFLISLKSDNELALLEAAWSEFLSDNDKWKNVVGQFLGMNERLLDGILKRFPGVYETKNGTESPNDPTSPALPALQILTRGQTKSLFKSDENFFQIAKRMKSNIDDEEIKNGHHLMSFIYDVLIPECIIYKHISNSTNLNLVTEEEFEDLYTRGEEDLRHSKAAEENSDEWIHKLLATYRAFNVSATS
jgi:hypothetical protein